MKNFPLSLSGKSSLQARPVPPEGGALAIVTNVGRNAVDACRAQDERMEGGRRSRSVLIPRRWYQVGDNALALRRRRRQESPVSGETTKETVKTIAQGMPERFRRPVVDLLVCFFHLHARLRVRRSIRHSLLPLPLRDDDRQSSGKIRRENAESRHCEKRELRSNPGTHVIPRESGVSSTLRPLNC